MIKKEELKNINIGDLILSKAYCKAKLVVDYVTDYSVHVHTKDWYSSWLISYEDIDEVEHVEDKDKEVRIKARKKLWDDVCNGYLEEFCNKHGHRYEPDMWVSNEPGTVAMICDMFVGIDNIRYDIDNDIPEKYFEKWYWKNLEVYEVAGCDYMNYRSFCKGAPDEWTEERLKKIREGRCRVEKAQKELFDEIENVKSDQKKAMAGF